MTSKPGDTALFDFNVELVRNSDGRLPPADASTMEYFALSCNHTVWFLKCAEAGMPCDNPKVSLNGRLSTAFIEETDPKFARRIKEGMTWTVINYKVVDAYPEIISLIIEAKNGPGGINRRTSTFEVLLQILDTSISTAKESGLPDWALVQRIVGRTKPACLNILPELVGFVVSCSGGKNGKFLHELVDIWKNCGLTDVNRNIPGKLWKALAESGAPMGLPMARLKNMFVLTSFVAETGVEDGLCGFITTTDVDMFKTARETTLERLLTCNMALDLGFGLISQCEPTVASSSVQVASASSGSSRASPKGALRMTFAVRIVRFLISEAKNKQRPKENYKTVGAIGYDLLMGLRQIWPEMDEHPAFKNEERFRSWVPDQREFRFKMAKPTVTLKEISDDGRLTNHADLLFNKGFKIGEHVKSKATNDLWVIAGADADAIVLEDLPARMRSICPKGMRAFLEKFTRPPAGYEAKLLHADPSWHDLDPRCSKAGAVALARAEVILALESAAQLFPDKGQAVLPMLNLKNAHAGVCAASNAKAGTIVLVPWTANVTIHFPGDTDFKRPIQWQVEAKGEHALRAFQADKQKPTISLNAQMFDASKSDVDTKLPSEKVQKPVAVFWRVRGHTVKEKKVEDFNMEPAYITVNVFGQLQQASRIIKVPRNQGKPDFGASVRSANFVLPVLVNKKDVSVGDDLIYLKYEVEKPKAERPIINRNIDIITSAMQRGSASASEPASKKARTA